MTWHLTPLKLSALQKVWSSGTRAQVFDPEVGNMFVGALQAACRRLAHLQDEEHLHCCRFCFIDR